MKVYLLPIDPVYYTRPRINPFCRHSAGFNIETGFLDYLTRYNLLTDNPKKADWHYLPIYWSYWLLNNNYGQSNRDQMQSYLNQVILDGRKTFTVSEADDEPRFDLGGAKVFSANANTNGWIPAPIITRPHKLPVVFPEKKYLANFVGTISPWPTRIKMAEMLKNQKGIKIIQSKKGEELFVNTILSSYATLCPRGSSFSSYRFYESMQLGVVPILISEQDIRPFPTKIKWDRFSYYLDKVEKLPALLASFDTNELLIKGYLAAEAWDNLYAHWPEHILSLL